MPSPAARAAPSPAVAQHAAVHLNSAVLRAGLAEEAARLAAAVAAAAPAAGGGGAGGTHSSTSAAPQQQAGQQQGQRTQQAGAPPTHTQPSVKQCKAAIARGFQELDKQLLELCAANNWADGCTAVAAWVLGDNVFVANVGDARCVLARRPAPGASAAAVDGQQGQQAGGGAAAAAAQQQPAPQSAATPQQQQQQAPPELRAITLTREHKSIFPHERRRIEQAGSFVSADGRLAGGSRELGLVGGHGRHSTCTGGPRQVSPAPVLPSASVSHASPPLPSPLALQAVSKCRALLGTARQAGRQVPLRTTMQGGLCAGLKAVPCGFCQPGAPLDMLVGGAGRLVGAQASRLPSPCGPLSQPPLHRLPARHDLPLNTFLPYHICLCIISARAVQEAGHERGARHPGLPDQRPRRAPASGLRRVLGWVGCIGWAPLPAPRLAARTSGAACSAPPPHHPAADQAPSLANAKRLLSACRPAGCSGACRIELTDHLVDQLINF